MLVDSDQHYGRPSTSRNADVIDKVRTWNIEDYYLTVPDISDEAPGDGVFYPSTQRHYRRLILLLILFILLHVSVVRPSSGRNILLARITQLTTDQLF
jgi:hypothetical protein